MKIYDCVVIGGGIVGCEIARYLTDNSLMVAVVEKMADVAEGATKANSGIIHAGFDCKNGTLKAQLNVRGSEMYPELCKRLSVGLMNCGAVVVGSAGCQEQINKLYRQGVANSVKGLEVISKNKIRELVPNVAENIECALLAKSSCVVSPYGLCIAAAEEAKLNGCDFYFSYKISTIKKDNDVFVISNGNSEIYAKYLINSAGVNCDKINELVGAEKLNLTYSRGEYFLLDLSAQEYVNMTVFPLPTDKGKGVLASITAGGNVILGPTAIDCERNENVVSYEGIEYIKSHLEKMMANPPIKKNIRVFSGVRTVCGEDFVIEKSKLVDGFIYLAGICSPGLSSAPAIAEYVGNLLKDNGISLVKKTDFIKRTAIIRTCKMDKMALNELIKKNPLYGKMVCRCEKITEGEIIDAINSPLKPNTVDGIKRRVRVGMGRCQGGFCTTRVMEILSQAENTDLINVTKFGKGSEILVGNIKEDMFND